MFADDTNLTAVGKTLGEAEERAGVDLRNVQKWLSLNKLSLNIAKTEYILIASRHKINTIDVQPSWPAYISEILLYKAGISPSHSASDVSA